MQPGTPRELRSRFANVLRRLGDKRPEMDPHLSPQMAGTMTFYDVQRLTWPPQPVWQAERCIVTAGATEFPVLQLNAHGNGAVIHSFKMLTATTLNGMWRIDQTDYITTTSGAAVINTELRDPADGPAGSPTAGAATIRTGRAASLPATRGVSLQLTNTNDLNGAAEIPPIPPGFKWTWFGDTVNTLYDLTILWWEPRPGIPSLEAI